MFYGREKEVEIIKEFSNKENQALMLYGKRKVGKTTLLKEALKDRKYVYYECIKSTLKDNVLNFVDTLIDYKVINYKINFDSFQDVFKFLNTLNLKLDIIIDEFPYLKIFEKSETIDSIFQSIIDNYLTNITLYISGSHIGMMKSMLEEKNALYGRFNTIIKLNELNYIEISSFYKSLNPYDKIAFYSVFSGSPFINSFIDENKTLKENIIDIILNKNSTVFNYAENLLMSDLSNSVNAERILFAIANGKKKYNEIESKLGLNNNGLLSKQLNVLLDMEIVKKVYPINQKEDRKKAYYEINDNLLRFYYAYIYKNKSQLELLGPNTFYSNYIENSIDTFISHRFEEICRTYFSLEAKKGMLKGILDIGTFYYDNPVTKNNGEFDVALKFEDYYDIYECKYYKSNIKVSEMILEESQIKLIKGLKINKIGFINASNQDERLEQFNYIDGSDLYK